MKYSSSPIWSGVDSINRAVHYLVDELSKFVLISLLGLCSISVHATTIETPWQKYETSHFVLYTDIEQAEALKMMDDLEVFKASLQQLLRVNSGIPLPKLTAYRFNNKKLYSLFVANQNVGGYYTTTINGPIIVIGNTPPGAWLRDLNIVFHEYIHFFQRAISGPVQPTWYSEGLAEFFSSLEIQDEVVTIGKAPFIRLKQLQRSSMVDLETLFSQKGYPDSDILKGRLYPSAWLVTHFMMLGGRNGFDDYNSNLAKMVALQAKGVDGVDAFNQSFDISLSEFKSQIREYAQHLQSALVYYQASYKQNPKPFTLQRLMNVYSMLGDIPSAKKYANELYQAIPLSVQINSEVGMFMAKHNNISFAKFLLSNVVKWAPESEMGIAAAILLASFEVSD